MTIEELVHSFYQVLLLYERSVDPHYEVVEDDYLGYLDRLSVLMCGAGNMKAYLALRGLYNMGNNAEHRTVKSISFWLIELAKKGEILYGV